MTNMKTIKLRVIKFTDDYWVLQEKRFFGWKNVTHTWTASGFEPKRDQPIIDTNKTFLVDIGKTLLDPLEMARHKEKNDIIYKSAMERYKKEQSIMDKVTYLTGGKSNETD